VSARHIVVGARPRTRLLAALTLVGAATLTACLPPPPSTPITAPVAAPSVVISVTITPTPTPVVHASPTPSPSTKPTAAPISEHACVASKLAGLSLKEKVGQLIMVGTPVNSPSSVDAILKQYAIGNVFLAGRSTHSAATLASAIAALQKISVQTTGIKLQISLDQEGGEVQTLKGSGFPLFPTAQTQGTWSTATLRTRTIAWTGPLVRIGVTLDLAPVADTVPASVGTKNPPIGAFHREYGSDPAAVARDITTVVTAAQGNGLLVTLKHFPGLGRVLANTDTSTAAVDSTTTITDAYLGPFAAGITSGAAAVMISSASYPKLDPKTIAVFSTPIVTGLLRGRLGFTGIVLSDDLGNAVAVKSVPVGERATRFIAAGGDIVLTANAADAGLMATALAAKARGSATFATQVTKAATLVLDSKFHSGVLTCPTPKP
jgi:beta-N-acetylhexosaminidase